MTSPTKQFHEKVLNAVVTMDQPVTTTEVSELVGADVPLTALALTMLFRRKRVKRMQDPATTKRKFLYIAADKSLPGYSLRRGVKAGTKLKKQPVEQATAVGIPVVEIPTTKWADRITICLSDKDLSLTFDEAVQVHRVLSRALFNDQAV